MISNGTTRRAHRWGSGARLASGVLLTAAVIGGPGTAHPADVHASVALRATTEELAPATPPTLFPFSADLLEKAAANLTDGTNVLSGVDTSGYPNFASFLSSQISTQSLTVNFLGQLQGLEEEMIGHAGKSAFLTNVLLSLYNLGWYSDSTNVLSLNHLAATGIENNLPFFTGLANMGLFSADWGMFGKSALAMIVSFATNLGALTAPTPPTAALPAAAEDPAVFPAAATEPAAALPAAATPPWLPTLTPQIGDPFLELIQKMDGYAFTQDSLGLYQNHDIIGTIAMQVNEGLASNQTLNSLGIDTIASQILAGEWESPLPVTTDFFEQFVTNQMNPEAFINGLPADPGNPIETIAYQLDDLLQNTVYATDLNAAALILWP